MIQRKPGALRNGAPFTEMPSSISAADDATLRLWDAQTGELLGVLRGHGGNLVPPVFTPDVPGEPSTR